MRWGIFVYFDTNDVNVEKLAYVRANLWFTKIKKSAEAIWKQYFSKAMLSCYLYALYLHCFTFLK